MGLANYAVVVMPELIDVDLLVAARRKVGQEPKHKGYYNSIITEALNSELYQKYKPQAQPVESARATKKTKGMNQPSRKRSQLQSLTASWGCGLRIRSRFGRWNGSGMDASHSGGNAVCW
jgi:hypothetical protein